MRARTEKSKEIGMVSVTTPTTHTSTGMGGRKLRIRNHILSKILDLEIYIFNKATGCALVALNTSSRDSNSKSVAKLLPNTCVKITFL